MEQALEIAKLWFRNEHVTATVMQPKVAKVLCKNKRVHFKENRIDKAISSRI